jgi:hypothetical protein
MDACSSTKASKLKINPNVNRIGKYYKLRDKLLRLLVHSTLLYPSPAIEGKRISMKCRYSEACK